MHKGAGITLKQRLLLLKINNKKLCHAYACFYNMGDTVSFIVWRGSIL